MAAKTVNFKTHCELGTSHLETLAKWLSCNGEVWGVGPTLVFASAAALFLYNELRATIFIARNQLHVYMLEKTLISTMVVGMLALMIHLWVCSMRFFQYYLDTIIKDSPSLLLEMTTAGLLGGKAEMVALGPLTRFLRQQQPQIHITICWFLSLCYADYIRKNYCNSYNMPYLEQWQTELHDRVARSVNRTMQRVNSFVGSVHQRMRGYVPAEPQTDPPHARSQSVLVDNLTTERAPSKRSSADVSIACSTILCGNGLSSSFSSSPVLSKSAKDLSVRLVGTASDTTAQAIEKLKQYVQKTRCSCSAPITSVVSPANDTIP